MAKETCTINMKYPDIDKAARKDMTGSYKHILLMASCSLCISLFLLISKIEPVCCVEWAAELGSNSVFLLLCLIITMVPSLRKTKERINYSQRNRSDVSEIIYELSCFGSGFIVFFCGMLFATIIQRIRLGKDVYPEYVCKYISYNALLNYRMYAMYYVHVAIQVSIVAGLCSLLSVIVYKLHGKMRFAMVLPIILLKIEDLFANALFGTKSALFYYSSIYMLSFGTLNYKLSENVHLIRLISSVALLVSMIAFSNVTRVFGFLNITKRNTKEYLERIMVVLFLAIVLFGTMRGILLFVSETNERISIYFISHIFDNIHFLFFFVMIFMLTLIDDYNNQKNRFVNSIGKMIISVISAYFSVVVLFILLMFSRLDFGSTWGRVVHTLSYEPPLTKYEFIVISNPIIEEVFSPSEALFKSFLMVSLVLVMISLIYAVLNKIINEVAATVITLIPVLLLCSGELFNRITWIYYMSPLSWTRLSLNEETNNNLFSYPSFSTKLILLLSIDILLFILLSILHRIKNKKAMKSNVLNVADYDSN